MGREFDRRRECLISTRSIDGVRSLLRSRAGETTPRQHGGPIRAALVCVVLTLAPASNVFAGPMMLPTFVSGSATYDVPHSELAVDVTWEGFDTISGGVETLAFDWSVATTAFPFAVLETSSIAGATLISSPNARINSQALIIELPSAITSPGQHSFSFTFSGVNAGDLAPSAPVSVGGNWDEDFQPISGLTQFLNSNAFVGASGDVDTSGALVPEPTSLALLVTGAISLSGYGWRRRRKRDGPTRCGAKRLHATIFGR